MMEPAELLAAARGALQQRGAPINAENLNRAMLLLAQSGEQPQPGWDAQLEVLMQEAAQPQPMQRRAANNAARTPAAQGQQPVPLPPPAMPPERATQPPVETPVPTGVAGRPQTAAQIANALPAEQMTAGNMVDVETSPGAKIMAAMFGVPQVAEPRTQGDVRGGTIPRANRIDEANPEAGMFSAAAPGGRQANDEGIDQTSLGLALLAPMMLPAGGAGAQGLRSALARRAAQANPPVRAVGGGTRAANTAPSVRVDIPSGPVGSGGQVVPYQAQRPLIEGVNRQQVYRPGSDYPIPMGSGAAQVGNSGTPMLPAPSAAGPAIRMPGPPNAQPPIAMPGPTLTPAQQAMLQGPGRKADTMMEGSRNLREGMIARARRRVSETSGRRRDGARSD